MRHAYAVDNTSLSKSMFTFAYVMRRKVHRTAVDARTGKSATAASLASRNTSDAAKSMMKDSVSTAEDFTNRLRTSAARTTALARASGNVWWVELSDLR